MTSHKDYRLDQLAISSQEEADELQRELDVRFDEFTYNDRRVWNEQNSYLDEYAQTRTVSHSADMAGVTVSTAKEWKYLNTLGFKRRLEVADLRFSDNFQVTALERAREPDAPASLLIALLRAHIPEKFSSNGHLCDTSKSDEILFRLRKNAQQELAAGHPTLRAIANGTYQSPHSVHNTQPTDYATAADDSYTLDRHSGEGRYPETARPDSTAIPHDDYPPLDPEEVSFHNLSPTDEATRSEDSIPTTPDDAEEVPLDETNAPTRHTGKGTSLRTPIRGGNPQASRPNSSRPISPIASLYQTRRPHPHNDRDTFKVTRF